VVYGSRTSPRDSEPPGCGLEPPDHSIRIVPLVGRGVMETGGVVGLGRQDGLRQVQPQASSRGP